MRWLGGVPVDRSNAAGFVEETARVLRESERMTLVLAPEGTRKHTDRWKSGFYRIAVAAGVPIVLAGFDYPRKVIFFGPTIEPTGDYERDLALIQSHFDADMALIPENYEPGAGRAPPSSSLASPDVGPPQRCRIRSQDLAGSRRSSRASRWRRRRAPPSRS